MAEPSRTIPQRESRNDLSAVLREVESRIDERVVAGEFARLVAGSRRAGERPATTDALIAATAAA